MDTERQTIVMIPIHADQTPVEPHAPGSYVVGYIDGTEDDVEKRLVEAAQENKNVRIKKAFLLSLGITFVPQKADPHDQTPFNPQLPLNHPAQPKMKLALKHGMSIFPLTQMDSTAGLTYSMPVRDMHWVYPQGSMIQDLEAQMEACRRTLSEGRSGIAVASPEALRRLNENQRPS